MAKADPTAPKPTDPVCDHCKKARAVLIQHDDDGTPHHRCANCHFLELAAASEEG